MSIPNTDLVEIHYQDPDPSQASVIAQAIVDQYLELDLRSRYEGTLRISNWLSGELSELKAHSAEAQRKVAQFQRDNNLIGIDAEGGNLVTDSLRLVNEQLLQAEADRIVKEARYHLAQTRNPELLVSVAPTTTLLTLRSQQAELMVQAADLKSKYGSDYPRVREVNKQLAAVQNDIDDRNHQPAQAFRRGIQRRHQYPEAAAGPPRAGQAAGFSRQRLLCRLRDSEARGRVDRGTVRRTADEIERGQRHRRTQFQQCQYRRQGRCPGISGSAAQKEQLRLRRPDRTVPGRLPRHLPGDHGRHHPDLRGRRVHRRFARACGCSPLQRRRKVGQDELRTSGANTGSRDRTPTSPPIWSPTWPRNRSAPRPSGHFALQSCSPRSITRAG